MRRERAVLAVRHARARQRQRDVARERDPAAHPRRDTTEARCCRPGDEVQQLVADEVRAAVPRPRQRQDPLDQPWPRQHLVRRRQAADDLQPGAERLRVAAHGQRQRRADHLGPRDGHGRLAPLAVRRHRGQPAAVARDATSGRSGRAPPRCARVQASSSPSPIRSRTTSRRSATCMSPTAMPRPRVGFVHAQASPTLSTPRVRGAAGAEPVDHAAHRQHAGERLALEPVRVARQRADDRAERARVAQPLERPVGGRGVQRHRPGVAVAGDRQHREAPEVGEPRRARHGHGAAEVARVVREPRADGRRRRPAPARAAASSCGSREPRPIASTTRSAASSAPASVRTPVTRAEPLTPVVRRPPMPSLRRTVRPGSASAIRASACSSTGRRTCSVRKRSSPGRRPPAGIAGRHEVERIADRGAGVQAGRHDVGQLARRGRSGRAAAARAAA